MLHENLNAAHHLTSSLIQTNHRKILKNPGSAQIEQGGHRRKYLLLEELRSPWDLSITSHESNCR